MKIETFTILSHPTPEDPHDLIEAILENPDEVVAYDGGACYLAAMEREGKWDLWSVCEESRSLFSEGTFESRSRALSHARERGAEILEETTEVQADMEDAEWEARAATTEALTAPFTFRDTTDFPDGIELNDPGDVYAFFLRHPHLLRPDEWGNLYSCSLTDDHGTLCWVTENHHGDMRIETGM